MKIKGGVEKRNTFDGRRGDNEGKMKEKQNDHKYKGRR